MKCMVTKNGWEFFDYEEFPFAILRRLDEGRFILHLTLKNENHMIMSCTYMDIVYDMIRDYRIPEIRSVLTSDLLDRGYRVSEVEKIIRKVILKYHGGKYV